MNDLNAEMVTISKEQYYELCEDSFLLKCLRNAGVDKWDGWDWAIEEYHGVEHDN